MGRARTYVSALQDVSVNYAPSWGRSLLVSYRGESVPFRLRDGGPSSPVMSFGMRVSLRTEGRGDYDTLLVYVPSDVEKPSVYDWLVLHPETRRWYAPDRGPFTLYAANATLKWDPANLEKLRVEIPSRRMVVDLELLEVTDAESFEPPAMLPEHPARTHPRAKEQSVTARVYRVYMNSIGLSAVVIDPKTGRYYVYALGAK